ncbi:MAG: CDP-diacylglycerol--serine O-phosphatidyltransferase [Gammaproteobacteria bacterium]|nr:CDP-diacylglycerol--serine O-phosphatidyltransferase [Gammaproteobacteria bacterium]
MPVDGRKRGRGIYLLPNLFTTSALLAGFYGIVAAYGGRFEAAAIAILVAMVLDGFDGRVARMTNTTSAFGAEYDSMSDMVSFGVAPAFLVYAWSLSSMSTVKYGHLGWVITFFYTACCGLRLARFNVQVGTADKRFFQGLACPAAAAVMALMVWVTTDIGVAGRELVFLSLLVTLSTGLLMVSNFMYYSFKDLGSNRRVPFVMVLGLVLILVFTSVDPPKILLLGFVLYALSGPCYAAFRWIRKRRRNSAGLRP